MASKKQIGEIVEGAEKKVIGGLPHEMRVVGKIGDIPITSMVIAAKKGDEAINIIDDKRDGEIKALTAKVEKLSGLVRQSLSDLSFLAKTTHSEYAQRREKEVRAEVDSLG